MTSRSPLASASARSGRWLAAVIVLGLVAAACSRDTSSPTTEAEPATTTTAASTSTEAGSTTTAAAGAGTEISEALQAEIDELIRATEDVRGLPFIEPPRVVVLTNEEFEGRIRESVDEVAEDFDVDQRLLELLGLLDPGSDLRMLVEELLAEQALGFYDGKRSELVVTGDTEGLSPFERWVLFHEMVHALTDQHFSHYEQRRRLVDEDRFDEASAHQALIEGDATYFQLVYFQEELSATEQLSVAVESLGQDLTVLNRTPAFLRADLLFPYDEGFLFVQRLVESGGIAFVDDAYVSPPTTTEQILDPNAYFSGEGARSVTLPDTPLVGYDVYEDSVYGEWGLHLLFAGSLDAGLTTQIGAGWGGDQYRVLISGGDLAFVLRYEGDTERDAIELTQGLVDHAREVMGLGQGSELGGGVAFDGGDAYAFIDREGSRLTFVAATNSVDGAALVEALSG